MTIFLATRFDKQNKDWVQLAVAVSQKFVLWLQLLATELLHVGCCV